MAKRKATRKPAATIAGRFCVIDTAVIEVTVRATSAAEALDKFRRQKYRQARLAGLADELIAILHPDREPEDT